MEIAQIYEQMAVKIIAVQEAIIGPLAVEQASDVEGLQIDWDNKSVTITSDGKEVIGRLIEVYRELFGVSSVEVSKDAVVNLAHMLQADQIPEPFVAA
jgi:hypothetical protein